MTSPHNRHAEPPLPSLTQDTEAFFTEGLRGVLAIHCCSSCGHYAHPPTPVCPQCWSREIAPRPVAGTGTVASFTVNHYQWHPAFEPPYVIAVVALDEQPNLRLTARVHTPDPDLVHIGSRVQVTFERHIDVAIPAFRLAEEA